MIRDVDGILMDLIIVCTEGRKQTVALCSDPQSVCDAAYMAFRLVEDLSSMLLVAGLAFDRPLY